MSDNLNRALRWPLWSWRNLAITVVSLFVAIALIGRVSSALGGDGEAPIKAASTAVPEGTQSPPAVTPSTGPLVSPAQTPTADLAAGPGTDCLSNAAQFVDEWMQTKRSQQLWLARMAPYATPAFLEELRSVDPANVPATTVEGEPQLVGQDGDLPIARITTDGGRLDLVLARSGSTCVVSDIRSSDDVPGAPTPVLTATPKAGG
ncbi:hypothetical protein [Intrasporangium calvum]|uniref:Uncharacterized protein n=1 Tax=Intrasporangium calvum (strain ATCC 23552 / DSM 43043 / JCM 3097 / NBRC 12989 / NCIMB 10167 / NRRL B-3866 / 7 KIP) TaxID=710696 RepID=E6SEI9_INTC7|nr:hypothetical protein [Intrasporangium calvum]ADU46590.1 hypothetical protein Intca_0028 [Intrasporangium calvum DSM 43043]